MSDSDLMDIDAPEVAPFQVPADLASISSTNREPLPHEQFAEHMSNITAPQQAVSGAGVSQERTTANMAAPSVPKPLLPRSCTICCDEQGDVTLTQPCPQCKADYCTECLEDMFRAAIEDPTRMPPKCCTMLQLHVGLPHLTKEEGTKYRKAFEEWMATDRIYCPVPKCSAFIPDRLQIPGWAGDRNDNFDCPECHTTICDQCCQVGHVGLCDRSQAEYEDGLLQKFKMKQCPKCRTAVRRMYGCSHIECKCGAHWCYSCQMPIHECNGAHPEEFSEDEGEEDDEVDEDVLLEREALLEMDVNGDSDDSDDSGSIGIAEQDQIVRQTQFFQLASAVPNSLLPPIPVRQPAAHGNNIPGNTPAVPDAIIPVVDFNAGVRRNNTTETTPSAPEVDLDAGGRRRWVEEEDLDLGEEPNEQNLHLDVWTCKHKLKMVRCNDNFPMVYMDTVLECNRCFTKLMPYSRSNGSRRRKDAGTQTESSTPPPQRQQQQQGSDGEPATVRQLLRPVGPLGVSRARDAHLRASNEAPYGCTICNVLYCGKCKVIKGL